MQLDYEIDYIEEIEDLGEFEEDVYDIGMIDTPHTFFANNILVHNSVFISLKPLISELTSENFESMKPRINEVISNVRSYINNEFNKLAKDKFFIMDSHRFDIKQELIAKNALWIAKKRYAMLVIDREGIPENKLEIKGIDVVRSSFPLAFVGFLKKLLYDILNGMPVEELNQIILSFENSLETVNVTDLCKNTSIKNIAKYKSKKSMYNTMFSAIEKGTPAHVRAAISFNDLIKYFNLSSKTAPISGGEKIIWCYLKQNEYGLSSIACRGFEDPIEIMDIMTKYIDRNKMYESELKTKIEDIFNSIGWIYPSQQLTISNLFFD